MNSIIMGHLGSDIVAANSVVSVAWCWISSVCGASRYLWD